MSEICWLTFGISRRVLSKAALPWEYQARFLELDPRGGQFESGHAHGSLATKKEGPTEQLSYKNLNVFAYLQSPMAGRALAPGFFCLTKYGGKEAAMSLSFEYGSNSYEFCFLSSKVRVPLHDKGRGGCSALANGLFHWQNIHRQSE